MRRNTLIYSLLVICILCTIPLCAQNQAPISNNSSAPQKITLKDGTMIQGRVIGFEDDAYIVETKHLGKVKINAVNLKSIVEASDPKAAGTYYKDPKNFNPFASNLELNKNMPVGAGPLNEIQNQLMNDPEVTSSIEEMMEDPELMKLLMNPQLMNAALSMDPEKIKNNPQIQELLKNPKMQELMGSIQTKMNPRDKIQPYRPTVK